MRQAILRHYSQHGCELTDGCPVRVHLSRSLVALLALRQELTVEEVSRKARDQEKEPDAKSPRSSQG